MATGLIWVELEGRRVTIDQARQEVSVLDASGAVLSRERIQVAAGSIQGIFSAVQGAVGIMPEGTSRNA